VIPAAQPADAAAAPALGRDFNFQFSYEHSAAATARRNSDYRYLQLPDRIDLSAPSNAAFYSQASVTLPGLGIPQALAPVTIPASRASWGLTIVKTSVNRDNALAFVAQFLGPAGRAALTANGPSPIAPASVSPEDYKQIPQELRALVATRSAAP